MSLSDRDGAYRIENLDPGEYVRSRQRRRATRVIRAAACRLNRNSPFPWISLSKRELSAGPTFPFTKDKFSSPMGPGKEFLFYRCMSCHGLQTKIAAVRRDEDGW